MANNYTQASFCIAVGKALRADVLTAMSWIEEAHSVDHTTPLEEDLALFIKNHDYTNATTQAKRTIRRIVKTIRDWKLDWDGMGFDWSFGEQDTEIWVRGDESIDIESAVRCIQLLARVVPAMQEAGPWYATWANTCSKPRVDEFSGGAVVFNARTAHWMDTHNWKERKLNQLKAKKAKKGDK